MIKVIFVNTVTGLPSYTCIPSDDAMYTNKTIYADSLAIHVPFGTSDEEVLTTWHWTGTAWGTHTAKPGDFYDWDKNSFSYTLNLTAAKEFYNKQLKANLYKHITVFSNFPEWKQANYNQRYTELSFLELAGTITTSQQAELTAIREIISWKNGLISQRDTLKSSMDAAITLQDIETAFNSMSYTAPPFEL